jgi:hypothetical protein
MVQYFIDPLKRLVVSTYHQFHTQKLYILSTDCIHVFCMDFNIGGDLIPTQHWLTGFSEAEIFC